MFLSRDRKYPRRGDTEDQTFFIKENTNQVIQVIEIAHDRILNGDPIYFKLDQQAYINVSLYAKGNQGQFTIGQMHLRRAMADESVMIPGAADPG